MISIVIPGRNDTFGYNLHKRVAISLNCFAANMHGADDEIIFVDCNTSDRLPTLPEAIADTLTDEAKSRLRILRVRPALLDNVGLLAVHGLPGVIAYNVGFRRSNPANRWIAATTSDAIVLPCAPDARATDILGHLADGYYALPRYEVPQFLWEEFNRTDPNQIFLTLRDAAESLHLREAVFDRPPVELDNCGDFQLVLRHDLLAVSGLDERMTIGWQHSDANLHVRLRMLRGFSTGLDGLLDAYHCSHQRTESDTRSRTRIINDWDYFVSNVKSPLLPHQETSWGLGNMPVEEIRLGSKNKHAVGLSRAIGDRQKVPLRVTKGSVFDAVTYPVAHVLSHVADQLTSFAPNARIGYLGANRDMANGLEWLMQEWQRPPLLISSGPFEELLGREEIRVTPATTVLHQASIFIVDFSVAQKDSGASGDIVLRADCSDFSQRALAAVEKCWVGLVELEGKRIAAGHPRSTVLVVNAIHTSYEAMVSRSLIDDASPFSTRTRTGMIAGSSHARRLTVAEMLDDVLAAVGWRASPEEMSHALTAITLLRTGTPPEEIPQRMLGRPTAALFDLPYMQDWLSPATVAAMKARLVHAATVFGDVVLGQNFLPHQSLVDGAVRKGDAAFFPSEIPAGIVASGPYVRLPRGKYVALATFEVECPVPAADQFRLEVTSNFGADVLGEDEIQGADCGPDRGPKRLRVGFEIVPEQANSEIEVRFWRSASIPVSLTSLILDAGSPIADASDVRRPPLDRFHSKDGRLTEEGWMVDLAGADRFVIAGPYVPVGPGDYEAVFEYECVGAEGPDSELRLRVTDSTDRDLFTRSLRAVDWTAVRSRTARFRVDRPGLKLEFRIEAIRFVAGQLRFTGLAYRPI